MIKNRLKEAREKSGYSINKTSVYAGFLFRRYRALEDMDHQELMRRITYAEMERLSKFFKMPVDELFCIEEYKKQELYRIEFNQ